MAEPIMPISDSPGQLRHEAMGRMLRDAIVPPTDTMVTLDLPLLLTKLSNVPSIPGSDAGPEAPDRLGEDR